MSGVTPTTAHAEVARVDVDDDGVTFTGELVGLSTPPARAETVARRRSDGAEARTPLSKLDGGRFEARVAFAQLPWQDDEEPEFWDLSLVPDGGGELPLGRWLDDIDNKRRAYVFPLREPHLPAGQRRFRPFYGARNQLFIRTGPPGPGQSRDAAAAAGKPKPRTMVLPHAMAAHRIVARAATAMLRRRPQGKLAPGPPKVTILLANAHGMGGTVRTILNVAGHLARHHEVEIISIQRLREKPFFAVPPGVRLRVVDDQRDRPVRGWRDRLRELLSARKSRLIFPADLRFARGSSLWTDLMLMRALWTVRHGVVIGTRPGLNLVALMLKRPGLTVIGQEHMHLESHTQQRQAEIARRYPELAALAVLTERDRETYTRVLGGATRLEWIPNAAPALDAPTATLERPVAIAAGRLTTQKGFDMLVPAFAQVVARHPDWTLRICGGGGQRGVLERLIMEHDIANNVLLMGPVDRLDLQMSGASMYVLSSRNEGLPMVMIEAMTLGLPVVSFDCPTGPREVIEDGRSGLLVENGNVDALAAAMLRVIEDDELRLALGDGAAARAKDFALDSIGPRWEALIEELT